MELLQAPCYAGGYCLCVVAACTHQGNKGDALYLDEEVQRGLVVENDTVDAHVGQGRQL